LASILHTYCVTKLFKGGFCENNQLFLVLLTTVTSRSCKSEVGRKREKKKEKRTDIFGVKL
jgi:hypothetical protein